MSETIQETNVAPEWQNATDEKIHDPAKAEHMAHVEDKWRAHAAKLGSIAVDVYNDRKSYPEGSYQHDEAESSRDSWHQAATKTAQETGPAAVQQTAEQYDALNNPALPHLEEVYNPVKPEGN